MKKFILSAVAAVALATPALAADMKVKVPAAPEAPPSPWDVAFGGGITSDYIFRGITQSNHRPSVAAYFEPRYNVTKDLQYYVGIAGESISFPNRAAAEVDIFGGFRPTFGPLALDFGAWYYWYPGGQCFNASVNPVFGLDCLANGNLPLNGNVIKRDLSFLEGFAKGTYTVNDQVALAGAVFYSPSVLNSGAPGTYVSGGAKFTAPSSAMPEGWGFFLSGEAGHWFLGTSDNFYCTQTGVVPGCTAPYPNGIPYRSYTTWNVGIGITKSVFTLDLRYYDTDLNKGDCNAFTSDHTARFSGDFTAINPGGVGSSWCGATFVATGKFDLTAMANLK
jgi:opacity protein-like surface antigen